MNRKKLIAGCWLALSLMVVSMAGAENNRMGGKFSVFGNIGYNTYAMGDVNTDIDGTKLYIDTLKSLPGFSGSAPENIYGGLGYNGGVQFNLSDYVALGLEAGALTTAPVKYQYAYDVQTVEYTGDPFNPIRTVTSHREFSSEMNMSALEVGPLLRGYLPVGDNLLLNGTLGVGYVGLNGSSKSSDSFGNEENNTFSGSTLGVKVTVGGEVFLGPVVSVGIDLGYRAAKITEVKDSKGTTWQHADGSNVTVDYSGLIAQGGLRLHF